MNPIKFYSMVKDGRAVCRACGRDFPHAREHLGFVQGAVRCLASPLPDHHPGPGFVRGLTREADGSGAWSDGWVREMPVHPSAVDVVGPLLYEQANGTLFLEQDVAQQDRVEAARARADLEARVDLGAVKP